MNAIQPVGVSALTSSEAASVLGGCDCTAHCIGRKIGAFVNMLLPRPGSITYDWTNK